MKINFKISDIEVMIDDEKETDRSKLLGDGLGCIESMMQSRLSLYGVSPEDEEEEESISPGKMPAGTDQQIRPAIQMANIYG